MLTSLGGTIYKKKQECICIDKITVYGEKTSGKNISYKSFVRQQGGVER